MSSDPLRRARRLNRIGREENVKSPTVPKNGTMGHPKIQFKSRATRPPIRPPKSFTDNGTYQARSYGMALVLVEPVKYPGMYGRVRCSVARTQEVQKSGPLRVLWLHPRYVCIWFVSAQTLPNREACLRICYCLDGLPRRRRKALQRCSLSAMRGTILLYMVSQ